MALLLARRCKDVLFALSAAATHQQALGRLALQKLIYLHDVLSIVWREVSASEGFLAWRNGPYDLAIQNAVDSLAFRGLVSISGLHFRKTRNAECHYALTEAGRTAVSMLT